MKTVVTHCYQVDQNYHQVDQGWRVPRQWDGAPRRGWSRHLVSILAVVGMIQASLNSDWSVILLSMKWNHWWSWGGVENSKFQPWRTLIFGIRSCEYSSLEAFWGYKAKFNLLLHTWIYTLRCGLHLCILSKDFVLRIQSEHKVVHHFHCKRTKWTLKIFSTSQNITHASNTDCAFRNLKSNTAVIFQQITLEEVEHTLLLSTICCTSCTYKCLCCEQEVFSEAPFQHGKPWQLERNNCHGMAWFSIMSLPVISNWIVCQWPAQSEIVSSLFDIAATVREAVERPWVISDKVFHSLMCNLSFIWGIMVGFMLLKMKIFFV